MANVADVSAKNFEATPVSKEILRRLYPGRTEIGIADAMQGVAEVLGLAKALEEIVAESPPGDWRAVAASLLCRMRGNRQ